jgi:hypothetical protein
VSSVAASGAGITNGNGDLAATNTVTLTVDFSENVTVVGGTPYLNLNDGGKATYAGGSGTSALTFTYTVAAGQNTADLAVSGLARNGATIKDGAGNNAVISGAATNLLGILQIDTKAPAVTERLVSDTGVSNTDKKTSSDALTGGGDPNATVQFTIDGVASATTATASSTGAWTFTPVGLTDGPHTVVASETDSVGNKGTASLTFTLDTTAPTVAKVLSSVATGEVTTGHAVRITLDTSEAVTVGGAPVLLLNDGGTASYDAVHSTARALAFNYTAAAGQVTTDLMVSGIELPSTSSIVDLAGNNANPSGASANLGLQINTKSAGTAGPSGGNFTISGSTELELFGTSTANVTFAPGDTGTLRLDASSQFSGTVAGLALGNDLDLADIAFGDSTALGYMPNGNNNTGGTLSATDGSHIANIALLGQYMASSFIMASDGHGGTLITDPPLTQPQTLSQPHA